MRARLHGPVLVQTDHDHVRTLLALEAPDRLDVEISGGQQLIVVAVMSGESHEAVFTDPNRMSSKLISAAKLPKMIAIISRSPQTTAQPRRTDRRRVDPCPPTLVRTFGPSNATK